MLPKVLVVDYSNRYREQYRSDLKGWASVIEARLPDEAERLLKAYPDIQAIIIDACLGSDEPNTLEFVRQAKASGFNGYLIASSVNDRHNEFLLEAGCTHRSGKGEAGMLARVLLRPGATK